MRGDFIEDLESEHQDPMDGFIVGPAWELIERGLMSDGDPDLADKATLPYDVSQIADLGEWLLGDLKHAKDCDSQKGRIRSAMSCRHRVLSWLWVMRPSYYPGSPSQTTLAARYGIDESVLSRYCAEVTEIFRVKNRAQSHGDFQRKK